VDTSVQRTADDALRRSHGKHGKLTPHLLQRSVPFLAYLISRAFLESLSLNTRAGLLVLTVPLSHLAGFSQHALAFLSALIQSVLH
jgi:hypothetical protein